MLERISQKLIGCRVKAAREAKGWTQDQLAQGLGLNDRQSVSDIENGKRALKPDELLALSDLLERDIEFFIDPFAVAGEAPPGRPPAAPASASRPSAARRCGHGPCRSHGASTGRAP